MDYITMCDNHECPLKNACYRAKATPSDYRSWRIFNEGNKGEREDYIELIPHTRKAGKAVD